MGWCLTVHSRMIFMLSWYGKVLEMLYVFIDATQTKIHPVKSSMNTVETFISVYENNSSPLIPVQVSRPLRFCTLDTRKAVALCRQPHRSGILVLPFLPIAYETDIRFLKWGFGAASLQPETILVNNCTIKVLFSKTGSLNK